MARIFLSYASENHHIADQINLSLMHRGHDVFFDRDDLPDGESFELQIEAGVKRSDFMVFLVSPHSVQQGRYTRTELKYARKKWPSPDGRVLPVMVEPTPMDSVPAYLKAVGIMEASGNIPAEVASTIDQKSRELSQQGRGLRLALMAGAAIVVLGGAAYLNMGTLTTLMSGSDGTEVVSAAYSDDQCAGDNLFNAIAAGELSFSEAKLIGEACAEALIPATPTGDPGGDRRATFAADFAAAATSSVASERRAAATVTLGDTNDAVESFFVLADASTSRLTKARHYRSAAVLAYLNDPNRAIEALEAVVELEPDDLSSWGALSALYRTVGDTVNAERVVAELQTRSQSGGADWQASAKLEEARRLFSRGSRDQAEAEMLAARNLYEQTGNRWGIAQTLLFEVDTLIRQGKVADAQKAANDALTLGQTYMFPDIITQAKVGVGRTHMILLNNEAAEQFFVEAQAESEAQNNHYGVAYILNQRGYIAMNQSKPRDAKDLFTQSRDRMDAMGNREGVAWAEMNIGNAEFMLSDMTAAENAYTTAREIFTEIDIPTGQVGAIMQLAGVRGWQGRSQQALELYSEARLIAQRKGMLTEEAQTLFGTAVVHRTRGDLQFAEESYREALGIYEQTNNLSGMMFALEQLGQVTAINGETDDARTYWQRALEISRDAGYDDVTTRLEYELSRLN